MDQRIRVGNMSPRLTRMTCTKCGRRFLGVWIRDVPAVCKRHDAIAKGKMNMNSDCAHRATFRFADSDISEIDRLKDDGFNFAAVTMRDKRGYERAFKIWAETEWSPPIKGTKP